jgi:hypothetical protein
VPWPFGLFDIDSAGLAVRSWHSSWWVRDSRADRHEIVDIQLRRIFSVAILLITLRSGRTWRVQLAGTPLSKRVLRDLRHHGYDVGPGDRPAARRRYQFYRPSNGSSPAKPE